mmetsp:Transcript_29169/g.54063  ORF Transcript_29169/g.54063 Transcript_29169/m.54063 type:complete len:369 (+) Transcript_29169:75-1181(+)
MMVSSRSRMPVPALPVVALLPADLGEEGLLMNLCRTALLSPLLPPPPPVPLPSAVVAPRPAAALLFPWPRAATDASLLVASDTRDSVSASSSSSSSSPMAEHDPAVGSVTVSSIPAALQSSPFTSFRKEEGTPIRTRAIPTPGVATLPATSPSSSSSDELETRAGSLALLWLLSLILESLSKRVTFPLLLRCIPLPIAFQAEAFTSDKISDDAAASEETLVAGLSLLLPSSWPFAPEEGMYLPRTGRLLTSRFFGRVDDTSASLLPPPSPAASLTSSWNGGLTPFSCASFSFSFSVPFSSSSSCLAVFAFISSAVSCRSLLPMASSRSLSSLRSNSAILSSRIAVPCRSLAFSAFNARKCSGISDIEG